VPAGTWPPPIIRAAGRDMALIKKKCRKRAPLTQELISIGTNRTALVPNSDAIMGGEEEEDYCDCDLSWRSRHCPACWSSLPPHHHACPPGCSPARIRSCCWAASCPLATWWGFGWPRSHCSQMMRPRCSHHYTSAGTTMVQWSPLSMHCEYTEQGVQVHATKGPRMQPATFSLNWSPILLFVRWFTSKTFLELRGKCSACDAYGLCQEVVACILVQFSKTRCTCIHIVTHSGVTFACRVLFTSQ
jgi:hypothetical protein